LTDSTVLQFHFCYEIHPDEIHCPLSQALAEERFRPSVDSDRRIPDADSRLIRRA
jgi:hypothetical protein